MNTLPFDKNTIDKAVVKEAKNTIAINQRKQFSSVIADFSIDKYKKAASQFKSKFEDSFVAALTQHVNSKLDLGATKEDVENALFESGTSVTFAIFGDVVIDFPATVFLESLVTIIQDVRGE